jgi:hypothetical protein
MAGNESLSVSPVLVTDGPKLEEHVIRDRERVRSYIFDHAEGWHRKYLVRLIDCWDEYNRRYFDQELTFPYIALEEPGVPCAYGQCAPVTGFGGKLGIQLRPSLLLGTHPHIHGGSEFAEGRFRFVADVLLHESVHQWQMEIVGKSDNSYHGHGPLFRNKANEIGSKLGLPRVRTCKRRGKDRNLPSCSQWPHNVRPDYYLGAYNLERALRRGPLTYDEWEQLGEGLAELNGSPLRSLIEKIIKYHRH